MAEGADQHDAVSAIPQSTRYTQTARAGSESGNASRSVPAMKG